MSPENEALAALLGYSHKAIKEIDGVLYDYAYVRDWLCADIEHNCSPGHELPDWYNSMDACLRDILPLLRKRGLAFECGVDATGQAWAVVRHAGAYYPERAVSVPAAFCAAAIKALKSGYEKGPVG